MQDSSSKSTLTLRNTEKADLVALAELANNLDIWIHLRDVFPHPYRIEDATAWFEHVQASQHLLCLSILLDEEVVGVVSLEFKPDVYKKTAELGYWLGEKAWGKGVATATVKQITAYAFETYDLARIEAKVFGWNPASKRVLEKCGYKLEGTLRNAIFKDGRITDEFVYGILPCDLSKKKKQV